MEEKLNNRIVVNRDVVLCDIETGEIIRPNKNSVITIEEYFSKDVNENNELNGFLKNTAFLKSFMGNGVIMNKKLTNTEIATLNFIKEFICYGDCILRKNGNKNGHMLSIKELCELKGDKYETFRKTMYSLRKKQVLAIHIMDDIKCITINPFIYCRGTKVSSWIYDFYKDTEWAKSIEAINKE